MRGGVLHPLFVHLHIALLSIAFDTMCYGLVKGTATPIFENRTFECASRRSDCWR